ncbi:MAG: hypothetical protein R2774_01855 [Saprospiraceae bacterium]
MNEDRELTRYMVEFRMPDHLTKEMLAIIPEQREVIMQILFSGKILSYTLSKNRRRLWIVFSCSSEPELIKLIEKLPMTSFFDYNYYELMFLETVSKYPSFSVN